MLSTRGYASTNRRVDARTFHFERSAWGPHDVLIEILYCGNLPLRHPSGARRVGRFDVPDGPGHE